MDIDPDYELLPARLRSLTEAQLIVEARTANEALTQHVLAHLNGPNEHAPEGLAVELRFIEAQLALSLKVRDNTVLNQLATTRARGILSPQGEEIAWKLGTSILCRRD